MGNYVIYILKFVSLCQVLTYKTFEFTLFCFVLDRLDGSGLAKLYVSHVPRTAIEQDVSYWF